MKRNENIIANRVGIYAQKSTEFTAVGEGLAPLKRGAKSPVKTIGNQERNREIKVEKANDHDVVIGFKGENTSKAPKLQEFPSCEEYYGKERWQKALPKLQTIGFVNWEINTMFAALDKLIKTNPKRKFLEPNQKGDMNEQTILNDDPKQEQQEEVKEEVISGVLLEKKYPTFDLRANIGDANHPNFHILPENRSKFYSEFYKFIHEEREAFQYQDHPIVCSYFVNKMLMIECKNVEILEHINKNIGKLNDRLWPEADLELIPRTSEGKSIRILVPPCPAYSGVDEILDIIKKQNRLPVEKWKVKKSEKLDDGMCLDVTVDGGTYLKLMQDQDDIYFLMKKVIIKLPRKVYIDIGRLNLQ